MSDGPTEVTLLRWPADESIRLGLAALGRPRLLLVDDGWQPPEPVDQLEDWLPWPPDPTDLMVRTNHLSGGRPTRPSNALASMTTACSGSATAGWR